MAAPLGTRLGRFSAFFAVGLTALLTCGSWHAGRPAGAEDAGRAETIDPLSVNAACYICHTTFVREEISKVHFGEKVTCIECHGLSAAHANDEDVGATKPDVAYRRNQVDAMCVKCHEEHDVPAADVVARFLERRPPQSPAVCTDCHGRHKIERPEDAEHSAG